MAGFRFKQFAVEQEDVAMKVGTDGVLLGAWADCDGANRILDIGTGTGVIALQMAQRNTEAQIYAVEIDETATKRARANFDASPWAERLGVEQTAVQEYSPLEKFDLIVSNPPYFVDSLLPPDAKRSTARHTHDLTFEELDKAVTRLLADNGKFALILPIAEFEKYLTLTQLHLVRRCDVHPNVPVHSTRRTSSRSTGAFSGSLPEVLLSVTLCLTSLRVVQVLVQHS